MASELVASDGDSLGRTVQRAPQRPVRVGGALTAQFERRSDGSIRIRSTETLKPFSRRLTDALESFAKKAPDRTLVAKRGADGQWIRVSYGQMLDRVKAVGQALASRSLSPERPIAILSDNDIEHFTLGLAAQWVGVPYTPVSPAYSTMSSDFGKLKGVLATLTPGLVFASDGATYGKAISACTESDVEVVLTRTSASPELRGRRLTDFAELLETTPGEAAQKAHDQVGPDTIAKFLFTSGSTKQPKGVINTQRMLCAAQQQILQCFDFMRDEPPVLVDWLPWNHTFGGNHNVGIVIYNGGTLYIDDGKPTVKGIAETLKNLREISPTLYFNVPKGFEEIARAMVNDESLRNSLFARVKGFMYAGAGLSQAVWDLLDEQAVRTIGQRIRMFTGLGMTEMSPSCTFALSTDVKSGDIGLPVPGVECKLAPVDGKLEARFKGPNQMPGYWRAPQETRGAIDDEGFYCTGDAVVLLDSANPAAGLAFDGRLAEDFKLVTGTFVNVGPLRSRVVLAGDPFVQDVVVTGLNRDEVGLLIFPRLDDVRRIYELGPELSPSEVLADPRVRNVFQKLLNQIHDEGTGSASKPTRAMILIDPPSIDRGEVTDKGSINQRAVLTHRDALIQRLYEPEPGSDVLRAGGG